MSLVERLRWHTTDYDGRKMTPEERPRGSIKCEEVDGAADRIEELTGIVRELVELIEKVRPIHRSRVYPPSLLATYDKARAALEEKP